MRRWRPSQAGSLRVQEARSGGGPAEGGNGIAAAGISAMPAVC